MNRLMLSAAAIALATLVGAAPGFAQQANSGNASQATTGAPHYEWQYHYAGHHPRYEGHWVLVR